MNSYSHGAEQLTSSRHKELPSEEGSDAGDRGYRGVGRDRVEWDAQRGTRAAEMVAGGGSGVLGG